MESEREARLAGTWGDLRTRHGESGRQLVKFSFVGASGFIVNLAVFAVAHSGLGLHYLAAGVLAFVVANASNYVVNRWWTFAGAGNGVLAEYGRFLTVGVLALAGSLALLAFLVERVKLPELPAQAVAILLVTPVSFMGNKLWTFRARG